MVEMGGHAWVCLRCLVTPRIGTNQDPHTRTSTAEQVGADSQLVPCRGQVGWCGLGG